jgi:anti-sigma-K factor RskA
LNVKEVIESGVLEMYVLGIASKQDISLVEDCIAQYPNETLAEINAIEEALATHAASYAVVPPSYLQQQIETRLFGETETLLNNNTKPETETVLSTYEATSKNNVVDLKPKRSYGFLAAASVALLIGSAVTNVILYNNYNKTNKEIAGIKNTLQEKETALAAAENQMDIVSNKYAQSVALKGTTNFPDQAAKVYWIKNTNDVYVDPTNLPEPPQGKQYQFWAIVNGVPVDGGMIQKKGTIKIEKMKSFSNVQAFAITLEKEGGSPTPSMPEMRVMGSL